MNNKKIVVLVANTAWSLYNFRLGLINKLLEEGFTLYLLAPEDDFSGKLREVGCNFVSIDISPKGVNPFDDLKLTRQLYLMYKKINPDFIIHYTIKPNIYGSIASKLAGIPSIAITTGLGYTFLNNNLIAKIARSLYWFAFKYPKEIWFLNEDDRKAFLSYRLVSHDKAILLHGEGVDINHFSPQKLSDKKNDEICFLLIARMLWDKGVGEFVEAARVIKAKYPHVKFKLLGACDVANPSSISKKQIQMWVDENVVEYLGVTDDVRPVIAQADCIVLPSYREGIPRTMIESAAMAKPLIVSDAPGCRDVVLDGQTGLLCLVKDIDSLVRCFDRFVTMDESSRVNMGLAGRSFISSHFDEKIVIKQYMEMLSKYC